MEKQKFISMDAMLDWLIVRSMNAIKYQDTTNLDNAAISLVTDDNFDVIEDSKKWITIFEENNYSVKLTILNINSFISKMEKLNIWLNKIDDYNNNLFIRCAKLNPYLSTDIGEFSTELFLFIKRVIAVFRKIAEFSIHLFSEEKMSSIFKFDTAYVMTSYALLDAYQLAIACKYETELNFVQSNLEEINDILSPFPESEIRESIRTDSESTGALEIRLNDFNEVYNTLLEKGVINKGDIPFKVGLTGRLNNQ